MKAAADDLKEKKGYCKLKEEALDHNLWKICFGRRQGSFRKADYKVNE